MSAPVCDMGQDDYRRSHCRQARVLATQSPASHCQSTRCPGDHSGRGYRFVGDVKALDTLPPGLPVAATAEPTKSGATEHDSVAPAVGADPTKVFWRGARPLAVGAVCVVFLSGLWGAARSRLADAAKDAGISTDHL